MLQRVKDTKAPPPEARNLECHFGFNEFAAMMRQGSLKPGMEVIVFSGVRNPDESIAWSKLEYRILDSRCLLCGDEQVPYSPRRELKGVNWYTRE